MSKKITDSIGRSERILKGLKQAFKFKKGYEKCVMVMGCQRSGTTLITHLFNQLDYCRVFGEFSVLSNKDKISSGLRLNSTADILDVLNKSHAPLIVFKPLVESQNAKKLLLNIPNSHVLWVYRHYKDVAASDIEKFKKTAGRGNIIPIIANEQNNWRCENSSEDTRNIIKSLYSDKLSPADCAALFWYARNILFFEQELDKNSACHLWNYENFISSPSIMFNSFIDKLQFDIPSTNMLDDVYDSSVNRASGLILNKDIEQLCEGLYQKLIHVNKS